MKFLDPALIARLSGLQLRARTAVEGHIAGLHTSPYRGHSLEFAQHREYAPGDEIRHVDWKVHARTDRFFVKQFQDETNLRAYLLLDASGSMQFAARGIMSKLDYAKHLAAALAYVFVSQHDAAGIGIFDTALRSFIPPHHHRSHLPVLLNELEKTVAGGETGLERALMTAGKHLKRRGLVVLLSDLLDDPGKILAAAKYFRCRHHEVIALQVLDPDEIAFPYDGEQLFVHLEDGSRISADAGEIRGDYLRQMRRLLSVYRTGFRTAGIDYHVISTDQPLERSLGRILASRS